jgi:hypothetical protein
MSPAQNLTTATIKAPSVTVLAEKVDNIAHLPKSTPLKQPQSSPKIPFAQLDRSIPKHTVICQWVAETNDFVYLMLASQLAKLEKLQAKLQEPTDAKLCDYITSLAEIKVNDKLEALFDEDSKWYRVRITRVDVTKGSFEIYFLDYGNSQIVENVTTPAFFKQRPMLRRRNFQVDNSELIRLKLWIYLGYK